MEAIILAGGLGTRLRSVVSDVPKCMADVAGRPFLEYILEDLLQEGCSHAVLAVGYKHEIIKSYFGASYKGLQISYSTENEPLGTGGAIKLALNHIKGNSALIVNGDTLFRINYNALREDFELGNPVIAIAAKKVQDSSRSGSLFLNDQNRIIGYQEKAENEEVFINGGIYLINKQQFGLLDFPEKFSFEKDFLEKLYQNQLMVASPQEGYFIDIGIPADYQRAQIEFPALFLQPSH